MVKEIISRGWIFLADHGVSATLRDLGRMGLLVLNDGKAFGNEVIPVCIYPRYLGANKVTQSGHIRRLGGYKPYYRSFWWGEGNPGGDISGYGIHGQFVRVVPEAGLVVTMYSTWPRADGNGGTHWLGNFRRS